MGTTLQAAVQTKLCGTEYSRDSWWGFAMFYFGKEYELMARLDDAIPETFSDEWWPRSTEYAHTRQELLASDFLAAIPNPQGDMTPEESAFRACLKTLCERFPPTHVRVLFWRF